MRKWYTLILVSALILGICHKANGINASIKKKYPNVLLTDDYGILNENDLASFTWEVKPCPFSAPEEDRKDYNYWQCFPRDRITMVIEDFDFAGDNTTELTIAVWSDGIRHEYYMRRPIDLISAKSIVDYWGRLAKNEKYVCLAGGFSGEEEVIEDNNKLKKYYWVFEKIKTKKGCDSYFVGRCNFTYKQFLQEQSSSYPLKKTLGRRSQKLK